MCIMYLYAFESKIRRRQPTHTLLAPHTYIIFERKKKVYLVLNKSFFCGKNHVLCIIIMV